LFLSQTARQAFVASTSDRPDDDAMAALGSLHSARAAGKELQPPDLATELPGGVGPGGGGGGAGAAAGEVWVAHSALELLLAVVSAVESLADGVLRAPPGARDEGAPGGRASSTDLETPDTPSEQGPGRALLLPPASSPRRGRAAAPAQAVASLHPVTSHLITPTPRPRPAPPPPVRPDRVVITADTVATMADILWRPVLAGLSAVLSRAGSESTVLLLLRGYQSYTYSAGEGGGESNPWWDVGACCKGPSPACRER
jgi:hypothetical protein